MTTGKNIRGILSYNENKVAEGRAVCIRENMFGQDLKRLSFNAKLNGFENYTNRNRRTKTNAVHISLNFHKDDRLNEKSLNGIAAAYMEKIGFGNQPYLVYQHFDAAHPHIHIVTTNIQADGKRISLHNIGKNQSEKARQEIEKEFRLVKASGRKQDSQDVVKGVDLEKAIYGKTETKRSIANIVRYVARNYKYTSLPELNAILKQFNVVADRGRENTEMFRKKGLVYSILDKNGNKTGVPIKASSIYGKPTLAYLEKQFKLNEALRQPYKAKLKDTIDKLLDGNRLSRKGFEEAMQRSNINVVFRENAERRVYGITFVDNQHKVVFNGSDLGKQYGAKAILECLAKKDQVIPADRILSREGEGHSYENADMNMDKTIRELITARSYGNEHSPIRKRKRKKKRGKSI